jgi:hypothetical protein
MRAMQEMHQRVRELARNYRGAAHDIELYWDDIGDLGEDFDFDDPREMRRRLPRLSAILLPDSDDGRPRCRLLG